jgi:hypothetical protein
MAIISGNTKIDLVIKKFGQKDQGLIGRASEIQAEMELKEEIKHYDVSIKEALQILIDLLHIW